MLWSLTTASTVLALATTGYYFYVGAWRQVALNRAYEGRIVITGPIPAGVLRLNIVAKPGQPVVDSNFNILGCVQSDGQTVGSCESVLPQQSQQSMEKSI
jgi:hypothetical protein